MATINTIEDLIRLLDDNPQWVEALRVRLLTRELIELPEKFARFAEATHQRFDRIDDRLAKGDERMGGLEGRMGRLDRAHGRSGRAHGQADG